MKVFKPSIRFVALTVLLVAAAAALLIFSNIGVCVRGRNLLGSFLFGPNLPKAEKRLRERVAQLGLAFPLKDVRIVVQKSQRKLLLLSGGKIVKEYHIGLGPHPEGRKEKQGDGKTPEGSYYVCTRNKRSNFYLFLGVSYPGRGDAERAFASDVIDKATLDAICTAEREGSCPPWKTVLGGEVGIHGHGSKRDWTAGCIALEDDDIEEIWVATELGTVVVIEP